MSASSPAGRALPSISAHSIDARPGSASRPASWLMPGVYSMIHLGMKDGMEYRRDLKWLAPQQILADQPTRIHSNGVLHDKAAYS